MFPRTDKKSRTNVIFKQDSNIQFTFPTESNNRVKGFTRHGSIANQFIQRATILQPRFSEKMETVRRSLRRGAQRDLRR